MSHFIRVLKSEARDHLHGQGVEHGNAYGLVVEADTLLPVICGHGGSMWLCPDCAEAIADDKPMPAKPCPVHRGCTTTIYGCSWPGCPFHIDNFLAKDKTRGKFHGTAAFKPAAWGAIEHRRFAEHFKRYA